MNTVMKLMTLTALLVLGQACGKAQYGFTGKKNAPQEEPQNFNSEQPQGNVTPNEYRGINGFWIKGSPGTVELGQDVHFTGSCGHDASGILDWQFGDGRIGRGLDLKHRYDKEGTYRITGICTYSDGSTQQGTITISVTPKPTTGGLGGGTQQPNQTPGQSNQCCRCRPTCY